MILKSPGPYRGTVVDVLDPEQRHRVRVRCPKVHTDEWAIEGIPWAECVSPTGKFAGMFFSYKVGELVWVMFEESDDDQPVVIGGWNCESLGVPDEPIGNQNDYVSGMKRMTFVDRRGNQVELSEVGDELHVRMTSGGAEVLVSQIGDEIRLSAPNGKVVVEGSRVQVSAAHASLTCPVVDIEGTGFSPTTQLDSGTVQLKANDRININSQDDVTGLTGGEVSIGGHVPITRTFGVVVPPVPPKQLQSPVVSLNSRTINIGSGLGGTIPTPLPSADPLQPTDALSDFDRLILPKLPTLSINIRSAGSININAATGVTVQSTEQINVSAPLVGVSASATPGVPGSDYATVSLNPLGVQVTSLMPVTVSATTLRLVATPTPGLPGVGYGSITMLPGAMAITSTVALQVSAPTMSFLTV